MEKVHVLDHGYVALVETWGSDERIVEAARMSTGKGFLGWGGAVCPSCWENGLLSSHDDLYKGPEQHAVGRGCSVCKGTGKTIGDEKLLRFLYENKHATPFEMGGLVIEVQAPIFVFREWHRHRTQSYNELSARYTPLPDVNYIPTVERLLMHSTSNKQAARASGAHELTIEQAHGFRASLEKSYAAAQDLYQSALAAGVPKELARVHLPVGRYSRMRASANLRNWLAFLTLRMATAAQWEIRQYANEVCTLVAQAFPRTHELFAKVAA